MVLSEFKKHLNKDFIESYNEESDEQYFLEVDVLYREKLNELRKDLPFLPERIEIEKVEIFVATLHDKKSYFIYIRNLKQALNHGLVLKQEHGAVKFNQIA